MESKEQRHVVSIYWSLILLFVTGNFFPDTLSSPSIESTLIRSFQLTVFLFLLYNEWELYSNGLLRLNIGVFKYPFIFLFILSMTIVLRGKWEGNIGNILLKVVNGSDILPLALPFIILPLNNVKYFCYILDVLFYASLLTIIAWMVNYSSLVKPLYYGESIGAWLPYFCAFLLPFFQKFGKMKNVLIIVIYSVYLFLMLLNGRRNVVLSLVIYGLIAIYVFVKYYRNKYASNITMAICFGIVISSFVWLNIDTVTNDTFGRMYERGFEDTRKPVNEMFLKDFGNSDIPEWVFGRGMDGTYHHRNFYDPFSKKNINFRNGVETGYLHLMLKGGVFYLMIVLVLLFGAIHRCYQTGGYAYTYLFLFLGTYLLNLYTTNPLGTLSPQSILFWFGISIGLSSRKAYS